MKFSTYDVDNDNDGGNCAAFVTGGWWYTSCHVFFFLFNTLILGNTLNRKIILRWRDKWN